MHETHKRTLDVRCWCQLPRQVPTAIIGYFLFESDINFPMACFMALSMLGGFLYSFAKIEVFIDASWILPRDGYDGSHTVHGLPFMDALQLF